MTRQLTAMDVIGLLDLQPLEGEGGFFRQTWAKGAIDTPDATAIYYLVTPTSFSGLHLLTGDEMFHFYAGDSCEMINISGTGEVAHLVLGTDLAAGELPQHLVPAGSWQGMRLVAGGRWALLGTTMTPGFVPGMFTMITRDVLASWPAAVRDAAAPFMPPEIG